MYVSTYVCLCVYENTYIHIHPHEFTSPTFGEMFDMCRSLEGSIEGMVRC